MTFSHDELPVCGHTETANWAVDQIITFTKLLIFILPCKFWNEEVCFLQFQCYKNVLSAHHINSTVLQIVLLSATVNEPMEAVSIPAGSSGFGYPIKAPWLIQLKGQPNSRETRAHSLLEHLTYTKYLCSCCLNMFTLLRTLSAELPLTNFASFRCSFTINLPFVDNDSKGQSILRYRSVFSLHL